MEENTTEITNSVNQQSIFSNFSIGGAKFTMAHIAMEVVIMGGISYYFSKKISGLNTKITDLQLKIKELETTKSGSNPSNDSKTEECMESITQLHSNTKKHITNIYQTLRKLSENIQSLNYKIEEIQEEANYEEKEKYTQPPSLKQRKKMNVKELPIEEESEDIIIPQPPITPKSIPTQKIPLPPSVPQMFVHLQKVVQTQTQMRAPPVVPVESQGPIYVQPTKPLIEEENIDDSDLDKELEEQGIFLKEEAEESVVKSPPAPPQESPQEDELEIVQPYVPSEKKVIKKKVKKEKNKVENEL